MVEKHICPAYRITPRKLFGAAWKHLPDAVAYQNVLAHEGTYLNNATCKRLIVALRECLDRLAALALIK